MNVSLVLILCSVLVIGAVTAQASFKAGHCPLKESVSICTPRCTSDYNCSSNQKCCPNKCGTSSCTASSVFSYGNDRGSKGSYGTVYCAGVKCLSYQKCGYDKKSRRDKCIPA